MIARMTTVLTALLLALCCAPSALATVAYQVPAGTSGTQNYPFPLGMDFNVVNSITITDLGVFDSGSNGLSLPLSASLWDRTNTAAPLVTLSFPAGPTGTLVDGSRFLPLVTPLTLPAGFQGTIVAEGYNTGELNGNSGAPVWTTNSGGGLLNFVGTGRYGVAASTYPANVDGGPFNRYAAGTFNYTATPAPFGPITLTTSTAAALFSQDGFPVGNAIDNNNGTGWADAGSGGNGNTAPNTAAFETDLDVITVRGARLTFNLLSGGFGTHTLGRFRISVTGDDRPMFADGMANGGDVTTANWEVLSFDTITSDNPATTFTVLGDGSILAGGAPVAAFENYTLAGDTFLQRITGFRLEMLEDPSLPAGGPGRASGNGNYVLYEFRVSFEDRPVPEPATMSLLAVGAAGLLRRRRSTAAERRA